MSLRTTGKGERAASAYHLVPSCSVQYHDIIGSIRHPDNAQNEERDHKQRCENLVRRGISSALLLQEPRGCARHHSDTGERKKEVR